jgi:hypothetical protein
MAYIVREQKRLEDLKRAKEAELNKIKNDPVYKNIVENANRNAELQIQLNRKKKYDKEIIEDIEDKIKNGTATTADIQKYSKLVNQYYPKGLEVRGERDRDLDFSFLENVKSREEAEILIREKYGIQVAEAFRKGYYDQSEMSFLGSMIDFVNPFDESFDHGPAKTNPQPKPEAIVTVSDSIEDKSEIEKESYKEGKKLEKKKGIASSLGVVAGVGLLAGTILLLPAVSTYVGGLGIIKGAKKVVSSLTKKTEKTIIKKIDDRIPHPNSRDNTIPRPSKEANGVEPIVVENLNHSVDSINLDSSGQNPNPLNNNNPQLAPAKNGKPPESTNRLDDKTRPKPVETPNRTADGVDPSKKPKVENVNDIEFISDDYLKSKGFNAHSIMSLLQNRLI